MLLTTDILGLNHVHLTAPKGSARKIRSFYGDILGMEELPAREGRKKRGCRFRCGEAELRIEMSEDFTPSTEAHAAFAVASVHALAARLRRHHLEPGDIEAVDGCPHFFVSDPFGNRLEFTEPDAVKAREYGT